MSSEKIKNYKKEFEDDINNIDVSCDDLKKYKISNDVLSAEIFLRKVLGDEIYAPNHDEKEISGEKQIEKLDETELEFDNQIKQLCENIIDRKFDDQVNIIVAKLNDEDEE